MYKCEYCGKEVYEIYGSGRFCSRSCACGFSSKNQSPEAKARKIRAGLGNLKHDGTIGAARKEYWTKENKERHSKRMSQVMEQPEVRKKISDSMIKYYEETSVSSETREKISIGVKLSHQEGRNKGWTTRKGQESYAEAFWRSVLDNNQISYQQEYKVNKPGPGCYFLDFLLPGNVDLEIDGQQHYEHTRKLKDQQRDEYLKSIGYTVYRIKYINPKNSLKVQEDINRFLSWYKSL